MLPIVRNRVPAIGPTWVTLCKAPLENMTHGGPLTLRVTACCSLCSPRNSDLLLLLGTHEFSVLLGIPVELVALVIFLS